MPLTLIVGPANSAKAGEVLLAYARATGRGQAAVLVVPTATDAAHYDRELGQAGIALGRALTFDGLIAEIARRGGSQAQRIPAVRREQLIRTLVGRLDLPVLGAALRAPGFPAATGRWLAELRRGRVTPQRLVAATRTWAGGDAQRSAYGDDIARLYARYDAELARTGLHDAEGYAWAALDALRVAPDRWGAAPVYFYGFDDLSEIERDAVDTLARIAAAPVTVSLTYEPGRIALQARAGVALDLSEQATTVRALPAQGDHYGARSRAALHHLERYLFEPSAPVIDPGDAVMLMEAGGERAEGELVAAAVLDALREGAAPEEIVVVVRSLARSGVVFERALSRFGIPVASARTVPVGHTPLGRGLLAAGRCAWCPRDAPAEDVLTYLRAPGVLADVAVADRLDRDLRRLALRTAAQALSVARRAGLPPEPLERVARLAAAAGDDVRAALSGAVRVLLDDGARGRRGLPFDDAAALDARAGAAILAALAEVEHGPAHALLELLAQIPVRVHPSAAAAGAVLVSDPLAIRGRRFRRVLVTGLCEGEFPAAQAADPFLGEERRRELAHSSGLVLAPPDEARARERYLLYACISRATERVTLSYRSSDEEGNRISASPFLDDVAALMVPQWRERRVRRLLADVVWPPHSAPTARELALATIEPAGAAEPRTRTLGPGALGHVRHRERISGSALEAFVQCPVRWLVERQLRLEPFATEPEPLARGSFLHSVLEWVFRELGGPLTAANLDRADAAMAQAAAVLPPEIAPGRPAAVRAAILRGIEADLRRYLAFEAGNGCAWIPCELEYAFETLLGEGGDAVAFTGKIDRVDVEPGGADRPRAIIRDYKSGPGGPERAGARWVTDGIYQAGLYMLAARRLLDVEPVAGLYQPLTGRELRPRGAYVRGTEVGDAVVRTDGVDADALEALLEDVERGALDVAATIRRGDLTPCPQTCARGGCAHPGICWA